MNTRYYECHITMLGDACAVEQDVTALGWKFSKIDGDIDLGGGVKCYATHQFNLKKTEFEVVTLLTSAAAILRLNGHKIIREKVEMILHDMRHKPEADHAG